MTDNLEKYHDRIYNLLKNRYINKQYDIISNSLNYLFYTNVINQYDIVYVDKYKIKLKYSLTNDRSKNFYYLEYNHRKEKLKAIL